MKRLASIALIGVALAVFGVVVIGNGLVAFGLLR